MHVKEYIYTTPDLCKMLGVSRWTLIRWEKQGRFTPPRSNGDWRVFTQKQIQQIVRAFHPGGRGYWHFQPYDELRNIKPEDR